MRYLFLSLFLILFISCSDTATNTTVVQPTVKQTPIVQKTWVPKPKKPLTLAQSLQNVNAKIGDPIFIRIFKTERVLEVWIKNETAYQFLKQYDICTYSGALGPKLKEGDNQSPEGFYTLDKSQLKPNSKYHLALNIGYPNAYDLGLGRTGSYLMIHGECTSSGCYAMGNDQIEEIYTLAEAALRNGQENFDVHIFPFRMTKANITKYKQHKWYNFWDNLKLGFDIFERYNIVPTIKADKDRYRFYVKKGALNES